MKNKELLAKDIKTLNKLLVEAKAKLVKDRFKLASKEMTKNDEIKKTRKTIAQILTVLREKEIVDNEKEAK